MTAQLKPSFHLKLRWKLLAVLLLLITLLIVATNLVWVYSVEPIIRNKIFESQELTAKSAAFRVQNFIQAKVNNLIARSQTSTFINKDISQVDFELSVLLKQDKDILEVSFIDSTGQELVKMSPTKKFAATELVNQRSSDKFIFTTFRYGLEYVGNVYFNSENIPMLTISIPVVIPDTSGSAEDLSTAGSAEDRQDEEILGVIAAEVKLSDMLRSVSVLDVGEGGYVYVVDSQERLIAHPNSDLVRNKTDVTTAAIIQKHREEDTKLLSLEGAHPSEGLITGEGLSETSVNVLATHNHLENLRWGVIVQQPSNTAFASLFRIEGLAFGFFLAGLAFTILVSFWLANFITSKISLLQKGTERFGSGNLSERIKINSHDEVGQLASAFNSMAENLQKRSDDLEKSTILAEGQKNQIDSILKSIADGVIALDFQGNILKINPAALSMLGLMESEVVGKSLDSVLNMKENNDPVSSKDLLPPNGPLQEDIIVTSKKGLKVLGKNKEAVYVNLISSAIKEGKDLGLASIITLSDVTKEKELEEMKIDFVSMAAHELRTPLTSVRGYLSVLLDELNHKLNSEQYSFLDKAFISSTQLAALVENLLSVARIERGSLQIQTQVNNWEEILNETRENFVRQAKERKISLSFLNPKTKLPMVSVDKFRITEVLSNLLGNALNYTPAGGTVEVRTETTDTEVITHVKDTGPGIPKEALPKLFTKFFRVSGVLEQGSKGTGLGLYISKAIVDMHKGRIWVDSTLGKGSEFSFSVPISKDQPLKKVMIMSPIKRKFVKKMKKV